MKHIYGKHDFSQKSDGDLGEKFRKYITKLMEACIQNDLSDEDTYLSLANIEDIKCRKRKPLAINLNICGEVEYECDLIESHSHLFDAPPIRERLPRIAETTAALRKFADDLDAWARSAPTDTDPQPRAPA